MMDRSEKTGLGLAIAGHIVLFGLLSVGFLATPNPLKLKNDPMDVTLTTEADLQSQAPQSVEVPSSSQAPELGAPEESAPPPPAEVMPAPEPKPVQPAPAPPPKPAPAPKPEPALKPQPRETAKPTPQKPVEKPAKPAPAAKPKPKAGSGLGSIMASIKPRERGSRLGSDFLKDISSAPTKSTAQSPRAAKVGAREMASVLGLIARQIKPCYDLGPLGGTSAMDIVTVLRLQFRPDGSVAAATVSQQEGVNDDNRGYAKQMAELSRRAVLRCSPVHGLSPDTYQGGWKDFDMGFIPRQLG